MPLFFVPDIAYIVSVLYLCVMGKMVVNGLDISFYGLYIMGETYKDVITFPQLKQVESNDWAEHDGIEVDLSSPTLNVRNVNVTLYAKGNSKYEQFIEMLMENGYNEFFFPELDRRYLWRLNSNTLNEYRSEAQHFTLTFVDDSPFHGDGMGNNPISYNDNPRRQGYYIDGQDLSYFGLSVLEGTRDSIYQLPKIKQRLLINERSMNGAVYDHIGETRFTSQDIVLKLLIRANGLDEVVRNYYGFMKSLIRPEERNLFMAETMDEYPCYYKQNAISAVYKEMASGMSAIAFDVTMCVIKRTSHIERYLVTDDGVLYLTDGDIFLKE